MGDARNKGGPVRGHAGPNGGHKPRARKNYKERWLERAISGLYQSAVDEPVPQDMLGLVNRIGRSVHSTTEALDCARRWRAKAEECRTAADSMETEPARRWFLQLARSYEALAEHAEREVRERENQDRETG
jgi:hypothetical protein